MVICAYAAYCTSDDPPTPSCNTKPGQSAGIQSYLRQSLAHEGITAIWPEGIPIHMPPGSTMISGFATLDSIARRLIILFRGTAGNQTSSKFQQLLQQALAGVGPGCPDLPAVQAMQFFYSAAVVTPKPEFLPKIASAMKASPDYDVFITGHSLGAAMAPITAFDLVWNTTLFQG
jgi:hypothetical protein